MAATRPQTSLEAAAPSLVPARLAGTTAEGLVQPLALYPPAAVRRNFLLFAAIVTSVRRRRSMDRWNMRRWSGPGWNVFVLARNEYRAGIGGLGVGGGPLIDLT